ncbi:MAG: hypothetical protein HKN85_12535 [Gammaproteobacteria bacterium]|nr:hypothetical protein [Gammaproteobacteria bacterium]
MIIANIGLTLWCLYLDPVINFDGVIYITIAQLFMDGEIASAFDYYSWPFYSLFIAATAKLLFIDLESAALVLNTLLATSLTLAFVCIVAELSRNNRRIIIIAMALILFFPSISKYRSFVIRDFGYLSCYLWSLYFIFRYCTTLKKSHLIGWLVFAGLSSLFRFEGIVFMLIAPYFLILFGATTMPNRKTIMATLSVAIITISVALLFWYINDKYMDSVENALLAGKDIQNLGDLFFANIQERLGDRELNPLSFLGLLAANTGDVAYELIRRMAVLYFIFVIYAYMKGLALRDVLLRRIWLIYVVANLLMLVGFSLSNNFIVSRYTMASALTLLILAPFAINHFIDSTRSAGISTKIAAGFAVLVLGLVSAEGLDVRTDKVFIKSAGLWMKENIPEDATIYSNNKLAVYYADRGVEANLDQLYNLDLLELFMNTGQIYSYDYVVLIGNRGHYFEDLMRQTLWYKFGKPDNIIYGKDGDYAFIFSIHVWNE